MSPQGFLSKYEAENPTDVCFNVHNGRSLLDENKKGMIGYKRSI